jgi:hypothetical protein
VFVVVGNGLIDVVDEVLLFVDFFEDAEGVQVVHLEDEFVDLVEQNFGLVFVDEK